MEDTEVKHNCIIYFSLKNIQKKVYESPLVTCLKVGNEKCESELILIEMIILEFRGYVVFVIHLCIISVYLCNLYTSYFFNFE